MMKREDTAGIIKEKKQRFSCRKCNSPTVAFEYTHRFKEGLCSNCFGKDADRRPRELNDLSGSDWARYSLSVQEYPDVRSEKQRAHGASFPLSLARQFILKYTKKHETIFDPFAGVGTTFDSCLEVGRSCSGMEINSQFCAMVKADFVADSPCQYRIYCDDAEHVDGYIGRGSIDFIFTSPPYASLLKNVKNAFAYKWKEHSKLYSIGNPRPYTDKGEDLGNMDYRGYFAKMDRIMEKLFCVLKEGRYMAWVVKDYRDMKNGIPYINFHGDIISCATRNGFILWDMVIYNQTRFRPLVCLGYPSKRYYHNIGHSYIVIFRKSND
jgi:DNA modification methylase